MSIRTITNQVFLLGLDKLYRDAIQPHERGELLGLARTIAQTLAITPEQVPVEGYYAHNPELTEYFHLVRALQKVHKNHRPEVEHLPEFHRLLEVTSAPLFGTMPPNSDELFPQPRDSLYYAMRYHVDHHLPWAIQPLTATAYRIAHEHDDISLSGLAARLKDPVVLTGLRESVVLYTAIAYLDIPTYVWQVDAALIELACRFISTFNQLFNDHLPLPEPDTAERYWEAYADNLVLGRCVRIGGDRSTPTNWYHWAIREDDNGKLCVEDFWDTAIWTTRRYADEERPSGSSAQVYVLPKDVALIGHAGS